MPLSTADTDGDTADPSPALSVRSIDSRLGFDVLRWMLGRPLLAFTQIHTHNVDLYDSTVSG